MHMIAIECGILQQKTNHRNQRCNMVTQNVLSNHILSQALKIMYPQRTNNLQLTTDKMGGSDPVDTKPKRI
jgi:hypothetical protein